MNVASIGVDWLLFCCWTTFSVLLPLLFDGVIESYLWTFSPMMAFFCVWFLYLVVGEIVLFRGSYPSDKLVLYYPLSLERPSYAVTLLTLKSPCGRFFTWLSSLAVLSVVLYFPIAHEEEWPMHYFLIAFGVETVVMCLFVNLCWSGRIRCMEPWYQLVEKVCKPEEVGEDRFLWDTFCFTAALLSLSFPIIASWLIVGYSIYGALVPLLFVQCCYICHFQLYLSPHSSTMRTQLAGFVLFAVAQIFVALAFEGAISGLTYTLAFIPVYVFDIICGLNLFSYHKTQVNSYEPL